jgi:ubiquinone/menaquinone biosynthesis C-methylase UbiE
MNTKKSIIKAYNLAADNYAAAFYNELDNKPFDRNLLKWFATQIPKDEIILEIGAGPGEVSGYLSSLGVKCLATDASEKMIKNGKKYFPQVQFEVQDFYNLKYSDNSFCAIIAFYAIVNLKPDEIRLVFAEVLRVIKSGGIFVFSFHIFEKKKKLDANNFFDQIGNNLTFYFFKVEEIKELIESLNFNIQDIIIRYPYKDTEYQSKRAYFIVRKK